MEDNKNLFIWNGKQYPIKISDFDSLKIEKQLVDIKIDPAKEHIFANYYNTFNIDLENQIKNHFDREMRLRVIAHNASMFESKMSTTIETNQEDLSFEKPLSREANGLYNVLKYFYNHQKEPLSLPLIERLGSMLFNGNPTKIRTKQVTVLDAKGDILFTPVLPEEVSKSLEHFIKFFNDQVDKMKPFEDRKQSSKWMPKKLTKIIGMASYIYVLFESIHPLEDGNGRIGRALLSFFLLKTLVSLPLTFSNHFLKLGQKQSEILNEVRKTNDISPLLKEFSTAFQNSFMSLRRDMRRFSRNTLLILDYLAFRHKYADKIFISIVREENPQPIEAIVQDTKLTERTLTSKKPLGALTLLVKENFIQVTKNKQQKLYSAHENLFVKNIDMDFKYGLWIPSALEKDYPIFLKKYPQFIITTSDLLDISKEFNEAILLILYMEYIEHNKVLEIQTEKLKSLVSKYIQFPSFYQETSKSLKGQTKYEQIIRNLKSNKGRRKNWIYQGWVEDIEKGFRLTQKGIIHCMTYFGSL